MAVWESDRFIVLGDGRAAHMGKGTTGLRSPQRKHDADKKDCYGHANLTAGNSEEGGLVTASQCEASNHEEPGAGKLHAGICEGGVGQPASLPR